MSPQRCFLFLQGPPSLFWPRLGDALQAAGHGVVRVNLCLADRLFWPRRGAVDYRGRLASWPTWLAALIRDRGVTDILYFADRLPYHVAALDTARTLGVRVHAIEFGYLRPDWLTLEPEAMGRHSTIPRDPARIRALAAGHPAPDRAVRYPHGFVTESLREVTFNLTLVFGRPLYPFYRSDKVYWPVVEYLSWLRELWRRRRILPRDEAFVDRALAGAFPYTLVALQLQNDYQIRASTDYAHLEDMLDEILTSLARDAPADRHVIIKTHPLDCGLENWPIRVARLTRRHGVEGRVHLVHSLRLVPLLTHATGVILANSTVGLTAISHGVPTLALGDAVYTVPGLTHQGGLAAFWTAPEAVDADLARDLFAMLGAHYQVRGSFYNPAGQAEAIATITARLTARVG